LTLARPVEPLTADDETLRAALLEAHIPSLLPTLAHITGDLSVLRADLRVDPTTVTMPQGGLSAAQLGIARELAHEVLVRFRDSGRAVAAYPKPGDLRTILEFMAGGYPIDNYLPMMKEELALTGEDNRAVPWHKEDVAPDREFVVAVIGAGMSGIVAAYRLRQAGVPFVVFEKNPDVGGTWYENTYPGCRVDIANHYYSYSFAQRDDWPQYFSPQSELHRYFHDCVDAFGIGPSIQFGSEVSSVEFDDDTGRWTLDVMGPNHLKSTFEANVVVSAVGQLNRPSIPVIEGQETFGGAQFHSARWDHDIDLSAKRVAVIGTGCSAVQFAPIVAEAAEQLTVFQRTPNWMAANPNYLADVPDGFQWLLRHVPHYRQWYRFYLFWSTAETSRPVGDVDPHWPDKGRSVGPANELVRNVLTEGMRAQYADRPELIERVIPDYPPVSKRLILDGGQWATMLKRSNVELVTEGIDRIEADAIVGEDGRRHEVDVIIYATGFQASRFLTPMRVLGRQKSDLHQVWHEDDARAYLGITVPQFPNFLMLYGPNTNLVVSGSITLFSECAVNYVMDYIHQLLAEGARALDLRPEVHEGFNRKIDEANELRVWAISKVNSWYKNSRGRSTQNWPFTLLEYWQRTRSANRQEYNSI
jgi:4-hydroxyacetophenone monooxygenase